MSKNPRLRRIFAAFGIACAINVVWVTLEALIDPMAYQPSRLSRIAGVLGYPGGTIEDWLARSGHDAYFVGGALVTLLSSLIFYAALVWVILSLMAWLRGRRDVKLSRHDQ